MLEPPQRHIVDDINVLAKNGAATLPHLWRSGVPEYRSKSMVLRCGGSGNPWRKKGAVLLAYPR
jgi:hypothetical protein